MFLLGFTLVTVLSGNALWAIALAASAVMASAGTVIGVTDRYPLGVVPVTAGVWLACSLASVLSVGLPMLVGALPVAGLTSSLPLAVPMRDLVQPQAIMITGITKVFVPVYVTIYEQKLLLIRYICCERNRMTQKKRRFADMYNTYAE